LTLQNYEIIHNTQIIIHNYFVILQEFSNLADNNGGNPHPHSRNESKNHVHGGANYTGLARAANEEHDTADERCLCGALKPKYRFYLVFLKRREAVIDHITELSHPF